MKQGVELKNIIDQNNLQEQKEIINSWLRETQSVQFSMDFVAFLQLILENSQDSGLVNLVLASFERLAPFFSYMPEVQNPGDGTYARFTGRLSLFQRIFAVMIKFLQDTGSTTERRICVAYILSYYPKDIIVATEAQKQLIVKALLEVLRRQNPTNGSLWHKGILALGHLSSDVRYVPSVLKVFDLSQGLIALYTFEDTKVLNDLASVFSSLCQYTLLTLRDSRFSIHLFSESLLGLSERLNAPSTSLVFAGTLSVLFNAGIAEDRLVFHLPEVLELCVQYKSDEVTLSNLVACVALCSVALVRQMKHRKLTHSDTLDRAMHALVSYAHHKSPQIYPNGCASLVLLLEQGVLEFYDFQIQDLLAIVLNLEHISKSSNKELSKKAMQDLSIIFYVLFSHSKLSAQVFNETTIIPALCAWLVVHLSEYQDASANMLFAMNPLGKDGVVQFFSDTTPDAAKKDFLDVLNQALLIPHQTLRQNAALLLVGLCFDNKVRAIFPKTQIVPTVCALLGRQDLELPVVINITMACARIAGFEDSCDLLMRERDAIKFLRERLSEKRDPQVVYNTLHALSSLVMHPSSRIDHVVLSGLKSSAMGMLHDLAKPSNQRIELNALLLFNRLIEKYADSFTDEESIQLFSYVQNRCLKGPEPEDFDVFKNACALWGALVKEKLKAGEDISSLMFGITETHAMGAARLYLCLAYVRPGYLSQHVLESLTHLLDKKNEELSGVVLYVLQMYALFDAKLLIAYDQPPYRLWPLIMGLVENSDHPAVLRNGIALLYHKLRSDRIRLPVGEGWYFLRTLYALLSRIKEMGTRLYIWNILYQGARVSEHAREIIQACLKEKPPETASPYELFLHKNVRMYTDPSDVDSLSSWNCILRNWRLSCVPKVISSEEGGVVCDFQIEFRPDGAVYCATSALPPRCITRPTQNGYQSWHIRIDADAVHSEGSSFFGASVIVLSDTALNHMIEFSHWVSKNKGGEQEYYGQSMRQRWEAVLEALETVEVYGGHRKVFSDLSHWRCAPKNISLVFKNQEDFNEYSALFKDDPLPYVAYHRAQMGCGERVEVEQACARQAPANLGNVPDFAQKKDAQMLFEEEVRRVTASFFGSNVVGSPSQFILAASLDSRDALIRSVGSTSFFWGASEHVVLDFSLVSATVVSPEMFLSVYTISAPRVTIRMPRESSVVQSILDAVPYLGTYAVLGLPNYSQFKCDKHVIYLNHRELKLGDGFRGLWSELNWWLEGNLESFKISVKGDDYGNFVLSRNDHVLASFDRSEGEGYALSVFMDNTDWSSMIHSLRDAWRSLASEISRTSEGSLLGRESYGPWRSIFSEQKELFQSAGTIKGLNARQVGFNSIRNLVDAITPSCLFLGLRSVELVNCGLQEEDLFLLAKWMQGTQPENQTIKRLDLTKNRFSPAIFLEFLGACPTCSALQVLWADCSSAQSRGDAPLSPGLLIRAFGEEGRRFPGLNSLMLPGLFGNARHPYYDVFGSSFFFPELKEVQIADTVDANLLSSLKDSSLWAKVRRSFYQILAGMPDRSGVSKKIN